MGRGIAGAERLPGRARQGAEAARGGRQGDQPGHGGQDQGILSRISRLKMRKNVDTSIDLEDISPFKHPW